MQSSAKKMPDEKKERKRGGVPFIPPQGATVCTANQCVFTPTPSAFSAEPPTINVFVEYPSPDANHTSFSSSATKNGLAAVLPTELYDAITTAAKTGTLLALAMTLSEEVLTDYLTAKGFTAKQSFYANQVVRAFIFLAVGASTLTTFGFPIAGYLFSACFKNSQQHFSWLTNASGIAFALMNSPTSLTTSSAAITTAIGSAWLTSKLIHSAYGYLRHRWFSAAPSPADKPDALSAVPNLPG